MAHLAYCKKCYESGHITIIKPKLRYCFECENSLLRQELETTNRCYEGWKSQCFAMNSERNALRKELETTKKLLGEAKVFLECHTVLPCENSELDQSAIKWLKQYEEMRGEK